MKFINLPKKSQQGFTLIELVVVIVILGILAVTAAPKFIDLQGDARGATIQAVKAAMESSATLVHSKSLIKGNDKDASKTTVNINSATTVNIMDGWPTNANADTWAKLLDISTDEFTILSVSAEASGSTTSFTYVYPKQDTPLTSSNIVAFECWAKYTESDSTDTKPAIVVDIDKC